MVKLMGHIAFGLLWAVPVWFIWDGRIATAFITFVLTTVMLPDVDLVLRHVIPGLEHHEITHTIIFVLIVAITVGYLSATVVRPLLERWWYRPDGTVVSKDVIRLFVSAGLLLGGLSHIFADVLSAPDIAEPIEPFWPFFDKPVPVDVIYYSSLWWNLGLLIVAIAIHVALASVDGAPLEHRYRSEEM